MLGTGRSATKESPMHNATRTDATRILKEWSEGDKDAPARLMPLIYDAPRCITPTSILSSIAI